MTGTLIRCFQFGVVCIYQKWCDKVTTCNTYMGSGGSLMQMGSKDWPRWCDPTDKLPLLKPFKWLMLILIIDRCHTWGRITIEQSGCPCWCPSQKTPTMGTWASELDPKQRKKVAWASRCITHLETLGTRLRMRRPAREGSGALWTMFFWGPWGCYCEMYHS